MLKIQYEFDDYEHVFGMTPLSWDCINAATSINLNPSEPFIPCKHLGGLAVF